MPELQLFSHKKQYISTIHTNKTNDKVHDLTHDTHIDVEQTGGTTAPQSESQYTQLDATEITQLKSLLQSIPDTITTIQQQITTLNNKINLLPSSEHNYTFYDLKIYIILYYNLLLTVWLYGKLRVDHSDNSDILINSIVDKLVYYKYLYERIKPLNKKLSYSINKLLQYTNNKSNNNNNNELQYKPNVSAIISNIEDTENDNTSSKSSNKDKSKVYKPPKLTAIPYSEHKDADTDTHKQRRNVSAMQSELLSELYSDAPEQSKLNDITVHDTVSDHQYSERQQFEEDNFIRLTDTKQSKKLAKQQKRKQNDNFYFRDNFADLYNNTSSHGTTVKDKTKTLDIMNDDAISTNQKKRMLAKSGSSYDEQLLKQSNSKKGNKHSSNNKFKKHKKR